MVKNLGNSVGNLIPDKVTTKIPDHENTSKDRTTVRNDRRIKSVKILDYDQFKIFRVVTGFGCDFAGSMTPYTIGKLNSKFIARIRVKTARNTLFYSSKKKIERLELQWFILVTCATSERPK